MGGGAEALWTRREVRDGLKAAAGRLVRAGCVRSPSVLCYESVRFLMDRRTLPLSSAYAPPHRSPFRRPQPAYPLEGVQKCPQPFVVRQDPIHCPPARPQEGRASAPDNLARHAHDPVEEPPELHRHKLL